MDEITKRMLLLGRQAPPVRTLDWLSVIATLPFRAVLTQIDVAAGHKFEARAKVIRFSSKCASGVCSVQSGGAYMCLRCWLHDNSVRHVNAF